MLSLTITPPATTYILHEITATNHLYNSSVQLYIFSYLEIYLLVRTLPSCLLAIPLQPVHDPLQN